MRFLIVSILLVACGDHTAPPAPTSPKPAPTSPTEASIGVATMQADGTIILMLRAEGSDAIGDAMIVYVPSDPKHAELVEHVGGLAPGQTKPVPSWPAPKPPKQIAVAKDGVELGRLTITEGQMGTLELYSDGPAAKQLRELWDHAVAEGRVGIMMHLHTDDGSRGPLGTRFYKPRDTDYAAGVELWLRYEHDFEISAVPPR